MTTPTTEPISITQGERVEWTRTFSGYSAEDYTLEYRFRSQAGPGFNVTATADGAAFDAVITAATTVDKVAGKYTWQAWLTENGVATNTFIVCSGETTMLPGFTTDSKAAVDLRSNAQKTLDAIDAAMLAFGTSDIVEYEISTPAGSRKVKRSDKANLMKMRKEYAIIVSMERTKRRVQNGGSLMQSVGIVVREN